MTLSAILSSPDFRAAGVLGAVSLEWLVLAFGLTAAAALVGSLALALVRARRAAQKQARKLRASDERFRRYADASQQGVWMTDARGKVVYVNPRLAQYLGCSVQEVVGSPSREFVVEAQRTGRP